MQLWEKSEVFYLTGLTFEKLLTARPMFKVFGMAVCGTKGPSGWCWSGVQRVYWDTWWSDVLSQPFVGGQAFKFAGWAGRLHHLPVFCEWIFMESLLQDLFLSAVFQSNLQPNQQLHQTVLLSGGSLFNIGTVKRPGPFLAFQGPNAR